MLILRFNLQNEGGTQHTQHTQHKGQAYESHSNHVGNTNGIGRHPDWFFSTSGDADMEG